jgi:hypothetical protein
MWNKNARHSALIAETNGNRTIIIVHIVSDHQHHCAFLHIIHSKKELCKLRNIKSRVK